MPRELAGSRPFTSAEYERATAVAVARKIALLKYVHTDQCVEFERVGKFNSNHFVKDEWKASFAGSAIWSESYSESVSFNLPFTLCRFERALSEADQRHRMS